MPRSDNNAELSVIMPSATSIENVMLSSVEASDIFCEAPLLSIQEKRL